ncbi:MAG TPA: 2OG-Fe(II) oxygenase [Cyclobacteriaceae bacterium]
MNKIEQQEILIVKQEDLWRKSIVDLKDDYAQAEPFPFVVIDNFLHPDVASRASRAFPFSSDKTWTNYIHVNEKKFGLNKRDNIPAPLLSVIDSLQKDEFIEALTSLTGISGLMPDEQLAGGGLHQMYLGGYLNVHSDFLIHPVRKNLMRRINLILFLSDDWNESYGGELEFWNNNMTRCVERIQPRFNRCVIFNTNETSYHGCPEVLRGPEGFSRKSIALYYYTEYAHAPAKLYTDYKARPVDKNKLAIYLDSKAVGVYSWLKQKLNLNDDFVSRCLRFFKRR